MSETEQGQSASVIPPGDNAGDAGFLHIEDKAESPEADTTVIATPLKDVKPTIPLTPQAQQREGTVEHLAARQQIVEIDPNTDEVKQRLSVLRIEVTRVVTGLRWEGKGVEETADSLIPLLDVGSVQQWKNVLIPFLYEIDRGGVLIPVWLEIIQRGDAADLPHDANPAETMEGRARRFAILMLGNYKTMGITGRGNAVQIVRTGGSGEKEELDLPHVLGELATDPNTSLYATQALAKHGTVPALHALISALREARGWAKVDIVETCTVLKLEQFYGLLIASGLNDVAGLESYVAIPLYRTIPLEHFLNGEGETNMRLMQQAALIFNQVLLESMKPPVDASATKPLPPIFERSLPPVAQALFEGARRNPRWQNTVAVHRLGLLLGRYWREIAQEKIRDARIIEPIYHCLPMMNDVERWMDGPGRDVLLSTLADPEEQVITPTIKVLGDLREPRATGPLLERIESTHAVGDRSHALMIGAACELLGQLGDRRAEMPLIRLLGRTVNVGERFKRSKRRDNLPTGDPEVPGSIVYAGVVKALGQLGERSTALESALGACNDFDPYVRGQGLEAVKRLDPKGEDVRSRQAAREALDDPRESVAKAASQLVVAYRDSDATSTLRTVAESRPELATQMREALRQLGQ